MRQPQAKRIWQLEDAIKERDRRIDELREERDVERELVVEMREQVDDGIQTIEAWIAAFDMRQNDKGEWSMSEAIEEQTADYAALLKKHMELIKDWNRIVSDYNAVVVPRAPRNFGRPLAASESQRVDVLKRRKNGQSLREIAEDTNLSRRTVRTILDKADGLDRGTMARLERIAPDKFAEARQRATQRARDAIPKRINATLKHGRDLLKRAKRGG